MGIFSLTFLNSPPSTISQHRLACLLVLSKGRCEHDLTQLPTPQSPNHILSQFQRISVLLLFQPDQRTYCIGILLPRRCDTLTCKRYANLFQSHSSKSIVAARYCSLL